VNFHRVCCSPRLTSAHKSTERQLFALAVGRYVGVLLKAAHAETFDDAPLLTELGIASMALMRRPLVDVADWRDGETWCVIVGRNSSHHVAFMIRTYDEWMQRPTPRGATTSSEER